MKKQLLLLSMALIAITAFGQNAIPNGNFETWTSATFDYPQNYPGTSNNQNFFRYHLPVNVTKTSDAHHGSSAVQLTTVASATDTAMGYFLNFNPSNSGDPSTWSGGMYYDQKPTGIRGWYKYNVATADSATIIIAFSKGGSNIGTYAFEIGGIQNSYKLFQFTFNPPLSATPDSVIFGALSCKLNGNNPHGPAGSTLKLDSLSFTGVSSQPALMNGDFENWQSLTLNAPANWYLETDDGTGINRTTDAAKGNYAIELTTYLGNQNKHAAARGGAISTGYYPDSCGGGNCNELGGHGFTNQIDTLAFYYKYTHVYANDNATIQLNFIKNGLMVDGINMNLYPAGSYVYEEFPFNIPQPFDTVIVDVQSSLWNDTLVSYIGADLKIDEIHFKSQPLNTDIFNYGNDKTLSVFPNPATNNVLIENPDKTSKTYVVSLKNIQGQEVFNERINFATTHSIDVSKLMNGVYTLTLQNEKENFVRKIVIQR